MSAAVVVENVSKRYRLSHAGEGRVPYHTFRDDLVRLAKWPVRWLRGRTRRTEDFWALKDVNFAVQPGEVVGVIGRNGAGKSTLLKVLSRITKPTAGRVRLRGRVGSLLEVGTGFHPELSGRENIYLSGAVMGMTRAEIKRKFDAMVAFAEVERFLDTPVKRYSSGMYMRLAFAVAAHLEPEILLVDEVLAVGDAQFQKKCLGKMGEVARGGRTILFVSHNMVAVRTLCQKVVWLADGGVRDCGPSEKIISRYTREASTSGLERRWDGSTPRPGTDEVQLVRAAVIPPDDQGPTLWITDRLRLEFDYTVTVPQAVLGLTLFLYTDTQICVCANGIAGQSHAPGRYRVRFELPDNLLNTGTYFTKLLFVRDNSSVVAFVDTGLMFETHERERQSGWYGEWPGVIRPPLRGEIVSLPQPGTESGTEVTNGHA
jgi:lipopolysaccharide transport system ATP-binding protein